MIFDEESILQERLETKDKAQGGAPDSSADTQIKELSSQIALKGPYGDSSDSDGDE